MAVGQNGPRGMPAQCHVITANGNDPDHVTIPSLSMAVNHVMEITKRQLAAMTEIVQVRNLDDDDDDDDDDRDDDDAGFCH